MLSYRFQVWLIILNFYIVINNKFVCEINFRLFVIIYWNNNLSTRILQFVFDCKISRKFLHMVYLIFFCSQFSGEIHIDWMSKRRSSVVTKVVQGVVIVLEAVALAIWDVVVGEVWVAWECLLPGWTTEAAEEVAAALVAQGVSSAVLWCLWL